MRLGFTGTQEGMQPQQQEAVEQWLCSFRPGTITEFHHGDCIGADAQCHQSILFFHPTCRTVCHPPENDSKRAFTDNDDTREPGPYLERNQAVVDAVDVLLAAPKEQTGDVLRSGTWATIRRARKRGIPIVIVRPDGTYEVESPTALLEQRREP
jgi:hypothetical protein